jgi:hypothetical protein
MVIALAIQKETAYDILVQVALMGLEVLVFSRVLFSKLAPIKIRISYCQIRFSLLVNTLKYEPNY